MSKSVSIAAKVPANEEKGTVEQVATITVQSPETVKEAVEMYGEEAILTNCFANWRVTLQGNIRSALKKGEKGDSIAARLAGAKMGVAQTGGTVNAEDAYIAMYASATPERQKEMLAALKNQAEGS